MLCSRAAAGGTPSPRHTAVHGTAGRADLAHLHHRHALPPNSQDWRSDTIAIAIAACRRRLASESTVQRPSVLGRADGLGHVVRQVARDLLGGEGAAGRGADLLYRLGWIG